MSLIAGHYSFSDHGSQIDLAGLTKDFSIDPTNDDYTYLVKHYRIPFGQVIAKYIEIEPPQIQFIESDDCVVLMLGIHEMPCQQMAAEIKKTCDPRKKFEMITRRIKQGEGNHASVVLDRSQDSIHIINNRFAQRPFYIYPTKNAVYFSSNIVFLCHMLSGKIKIDPIGWLQILNFSHTIGPRTNIQNVSRLLPATHFQLSPQGIEQKQYWKLQYEVDYNLKPKEHAERVFKAFQYSSNFRAHVGPNKFLALSGGLDSRLVAGGIPTDADFHTLTFVNSTQEQETLEVIAAREVSRIIGAEQKVVNLPQTAVSDIADALIWLVGGLVPIHHSVKSWQYVLEMQKTGGYFLGGGPGDVLAGSYINSIYQIGKSDRDNKLSRYFKNRCNFSCSQLQQVLSSDILGECWPSFEESVKESHLSLSGETAAHNITAWAMIYRQPAFTFTSQVHTLPNTMGMCPHLGYEYTDLMLKLPAPWLYQKNFYKYMIYHCLPDLREVVYANTGRKISGKFHNYKAHLLKKRFTAPVWKTLNATGLIPKSKKSLPKQHYEYSLIQKDTEALNQTVEIIHSIDKIKEILNVEGCDSFIKGYKKNKLLTANQAKDAELMGGLITLCYWYKLWHG